jgi:plasmid maintenance system antidote protein VapI
MTGDLKHCRGVSDQLYRINKQIAARSSGPSLEEIEELQRRVDVWHAEKSKEAREQKQLTTCRRGDKLEV